MEDKILWHSLNSEQAIKALSSDSNKGLSGNKIEARRKEFGKNLLPEEKSPSDLFIVMHGTIKKPHGLYSFCGGSPNPYLKKFY